MLGQPYLLQSSLWSGGRTESRGISSCRSRVNDKRIRPLLLRPRWPQNGAAATSPEGTSCPCQDAQSEDRVLQAVLVNQVAFLSLNHR